MGEQVIEFFQNLIGNSYLVIFIVSMIPVVELRGAIPVGIHAYGMPWWSSALISLAGGAVVTILLLCFLEPVFGLLKKTRLFGRMVGFFERKFKKKSDKIEQKVEDAQQQGKKQGRIFWIKFFSVLTFVAIPLPGTGVWTGAAVAVFLNMRFREAFSALTLGNVVAAVVVTAVSMLF